MIMQQWHASATTRHSYTLTYQFFADLQTYIVIQFGLPAILNNSLALEVGVATQKSSGALRAPEAEPPFLNF